MKINSRFVISLTALYVLIFSIKPADAYLDPGTGSMVIQAVLAGIAVVSVSVGIYWKRIKLFFGRKSRGGEQREEQGQNEKRGTESK